MNVPAERLDYLYTLFTQVFRHYAQHFVALLHANQREAYSRVAAGCLYKGGVWPDSSRALRRFHHGDAQPVLHAGAGIETLQFRPDGFPFR